MKNITNGKQKHLSSSFSKTKQKDKGTEPYCQKSLKMTILLPPKKDKDSDSFYLFIFLIYLKKQQP